MLAIRPDMVQIIPCSVSFGGQYLNSVSCGRRLESTSNTYAWYGSDIST
jgi:hypothetical protein